MGVDDKQEVLLRVENLKRDFGKKNVLNSINFDVKKGEIFGIIGMSGSGKTVLLKALVNFYRPSAGKITFTNINQKKLEFRKFFGFSTQESCFYPELTTRENLYHFGRLYGIKGNILKDRIKELLNLLELEDATNVAGFKLSGGMQKRLDIACSMIHKPQLLLLDEPTVELDPILRHGVMSLIRRINSEEGITIVIASHLLGGIETLCRNVAILHKGEMLEIGSIEKLREAYGGNGEVFLRTSGEQKKLLQRLEGKRQMLKINSIADHGHQCVTIYTKDTEGVVKYILPLLKQMDDKIIEMRVSKPSLSEIFTSIVTKKRKSINRNQKIP
jgi:ABC-2 type transport system ATP-binding protein